MSTAISELQQRFADVDNIDFFVNEDLVGVRVNNNLARATILLQGAQLLDFTPSQQRPIIWCSQNVKYQSGTPLRGGIPVCWPWFGPLQQNSKEVQQQCMLPIKSAPQHGFVRNQDWHLETIENLPDGATRLQFCVSDSQASRALFKRKFHLRLEFVIASTLRLNLMVRNAESTLPLSFTGALHSYFAVEDITQTHVTGLENTAYLDSIDQQQIKKQKGLITIESETDRVYFSEHKASSNDALGNQVIHSPNREVGLWSTGSQSVVVWNPWVEKARALSQFQDHEYLKMLCIETANAHNDVIALAPGETHQLGATIGYIRTPH